MSEQRHIGKSWKLIAWCVICSLKLLNHILCSNGSSVKSCFDRRRQQRIKGKFWSPAPVVYGRVNRRSLKVSVRYQKAAADGATGTGFEKVFYQSTALCVP